MDRSLPSSDDQMRDLLRDLGERVYKLERGGAVAGKISLDSTIMIGVVEVAVVDTGGGSVDLVFTNTATGASYTVAL